MPLPNYPDILKEADWNAKKGTLAKAAGETGVGAALKALITTVNGIDWTKLRVASAHKDEAEVDEAIKEFKAAFPRLDAVRASAYKVRDLAKAAAKKFQDNRLIPKASGQHALAVAAAAESYGLAMKSFDPTAEFEEARKRVQVKLKLGRDQLKGLVVKVESGAAALDRADVTHVEWSTFWGKPLRGLQAGIAVIPELKGPFSPIFVKLTSQDFLGPTDQKSDEIRKKVVVVRQAIAKLKAVVG